MPYCTVEETKQYLSITTDADDVLLHSLIDRAQAIIDNKVHCAFEVSTDSTRYFDAVADVDGSTLLLRDHLASITSVVNGDGTTVTSGQYVTNPRNETPYYSIRLLSSSGVTWGYTTDPENAIAVTGKWGYSTTVPDDIAWACTRLVSWLYRQKDTSADADMPILTGDGNVLIPSAMPKDIIDVLKTYRRRT